MVQGMCNGRPTATVERDSKRKKIITTNKKCDIL